MTNVVHISRDDLLDGAAERRAIAAYRRDGIEECLFEALSALGWQYEDIAAVARGRTAMAFRWATKQNCAAWPMDCPPGPMSALGGSGRAAPKEEVQV